MTDLVVFDIDKTLVKGNLHEILIAYWAGGNKLRLLFLLMHSLLIKILPHRVLKRKLEYFPVLFFREYDIKKWTHSVINSDELTNFEIMRRIKRYKNNGVAVALVTAAPLKVVRSLSLHLGIPAYASKSFMGVIYDDLLAKKSKVYDQLEMNGYRIRSIYSDSRLDFKGGAKNFLISDCIEIVKPI